MPFWKNKKVLLSFVCLALFLLIIIPIVFFLFRENQKNKVVDEIRTISSKHTNSLNQDQIQKALDIINNKNLSESDRYKALDNITFYLSAAYSSTHDPAIREFVASSLNDFAKNNFPNDYSEVTFTLPCADSVCGEKLDSRFNEIQNEINESGINPKKLNTINKNLEHAGYIPVNESDEKEYGFSLVIDQLLFENNPKASAAAQHLKEYAVEKYKFKL